MNMKPSLNSRWMWLPPAVLVLLFAMVYFAELNLPLFRGGNSLSLYTGEWFWSNITLFGDTMVVFALLLPFVGRRPELIWSMLVSACIVTMMVHLGKYFIDSPRPAAVLQHETLQLIGYVARSSSFPSGHTAAAFVLTACMALYPLPATLKWTALVVAVLVGLSRMVVGIHWPLDVLAGALTGWLGAGAGCYLASHWRVGLRPAAQIVQAVLLVILALLTMFSHDGGYVQGRLLLILLPALMLWLAVPGLKYLFSQAGTKTEQ